MTAIPLYVRDGSRFVLHDPIAQHTPPIPVPVAVEVDEDPAPNRTVIPAPKCPHGHFVRWAARNCRPCMTPTRRNPR